MRSLSAWLALVLLAACGPGSTEAQVDTRGPGGSTAVRAAESLVSSLNDGDFAAAVDFAVEGHAALAALAEGASAAEVAEALKSGDRDIAANFWAGFAQGTGSFLFGPVGFQGSDPISRDGVDFDVVIVNPPEGGQREIFLQDEDGYRIDLFASFGAGLAPRMVQPVERLLTLSTDESVVVLRALRDIVPSLFVAAERPGLPPESVQAILQLIEVITRIG